jgi:hypothetical protein
MDCYKDEFILNYWNYFLSLENELIDIERIIPFDNINSHTFSMHYMKIYFSLCSEIDVILKDFIEFNGWFSFSKTDGNFGKYKEIILNQIPNFANEVIIFLDKEEIMPFNNWNSNVKPTWWDDYNCIKHNRTLKFNGIESYKKANQENIINAFCALYQIEMYFYKYIIDKNNNNDKLRMPVPQSKRVRIKNWSDNTLLIDNRYILYINDQGNLMLQGALN